MQHNSPSVPIPLVARQFVSSDTEAFENKLRELIGLQIQNETNLRTKLAEATRNGFAQRTADELAAYDREDERLSGEFLRIYASYTDAVIHERRQQIATTARRAGKNDVANSFVPAGTRSGPGSLGSSGAQKFVYPS